MLKPSRHQSENNLLNLVNILYIALNIGRNLHICLSPSNMPLLTPSGDINSVSIHLSIHPSIHLFNQMDGQTLFVSPLMKLMTEGHYNAKHIPTFYRLNTSFSSLFDMEWYNNDVVQYSVTTK